MVHKIFTENNKPILVYETEAFNDALLQALIDSEADLVVLAGCLVVIPPKIVEHFKNRIIRFDIIDLL